MGIGSGRRGLKVNRVCPARLRGWILHAGSGDQQRPMGRRRPVGWWSFSFPHFCHLPAHPLHEKVKGSRCGLQAGNLALVGVPVSVLNCAFPGARSASFRLMIPNIFPENPTWLGLKGKGERSKAYWGVAIVAPQCPWLTTPCRQVRERSLR